MAQVSVVIEHSSGDQCDNLSCLLKRDDTCSAGEHESASASSLDTQECFFAMLGADFTSLELDNEEVDLDCPDGSTTPSSASLALPGRCSRYLHPPNVCAAVTIDHFYSKSECEQLIQLASGASTATTTPTRGFQYITEAAHTAPDGTSYSIQLQNPNPHKLSVFEHPATVANMWTRLLTKARILPLLQPFMDRTKCGPPLGLNPRLRVLRYDSSDDDRFEPHFDATTMVGPDTAGQRSRSLLTVLMYLNDGGGVDFEGGETLFLDSHISALSTPQQQEQKNDVVYPEGTTSNSTTTSNETKVTPQRGKVVIFEHDLFHSGARLMLGTKYVLRTDILFAAANVGEEQYANDGSPHLGETFPTTTTSDTEEGPTKRMLMSDLILSLCNNINNNELTIQISETEKEILDDMGLLHITLDAFLSPGITLLKAMLEDGGIGKSTVDQLVDFAACMVEKS
jgi:hypothetical protein